MRRHGCNIDSDQGRQLSQKVHKWAGWSPSPHEVFDCFVLAFSTPFTIARSIRVVPIHRYPRVLNNRWFNYTSRSAFASWSLPSIRNRFPPCERGKTSSDGFEVFATCVVDHTRTYSTSKSSRKIADYASHSPVRSDDRL